MNHDSILMLIFIACLCGSSFYVGAITGVLELTEHMRRKGKR